ncbi:hypothetical protein RRG08_036742 [Elysia crispata]|uniref:Uncharacterized protein n=1 Tax=Elysia crispata TaxID=231223 RepID=A0AAE0ZGG3_9GAST|nr:hypothetical protein RRG08_036742 [Elysia crispata]
MLCGYDGRGTHSSNIKGGQIKGCHLTSQGSDVMKYGVKRTQREAGGSRRVSRFWSSAHQLSWKGEVAFYNGPSPILFVFGYLKGERFAGFICPSC